MYNYIKDEGAKHPLFVFSTDNSDIYKVEFFPYDYNPSFTKKLFILSFFPISRSFYKYDIKISSTIVSIIKAFLNTDSEIALWYMCSLEDYKPRVRYIVFNKWFNVFSEDFEDYSRSDRIFSCYGEESEVFYISLIYNHIVFDKELIEQEIDLAKSSIENLKS